MPAAFPLSFQDSGEGTPLILVHGMASDRAAWDGVWPALARERRIIRYDLRGFGASTGGVDESYSHANDLRALMDRLNIARCDLLGVSMGGSIALHFALDHPERVQRLVLESPSLKGWDWSDDWRALDQAIEHAARDDSVQAARALWLRHPLFATLNPQAAAVIAAEVARYSGRHWLGADAHAPLLRADVERLDQLAPPTLLITGARDMPDLRLIAETLMAMVPNISRTDVEDAGHLVHLERPDAFLAAVDSFLT